MVEQIEEGLIKGAIDAISIEKAEKILEQVKTCICKINGKKKGTGFFCKILYKKKLIHVLMTNYHILDENFIEDNQQINIIINENKKIMKIEQNSIIYLSEENEYDLIMIKLNENFINNYLEIDEDIFLENSEKSYKDDSIYILHYPSGGNASISFGYGLEKIDEHNIKHLCNTEFCSSGGPILSLSTNKIIGIHRGCYRNCKKRENIYNIGTFLKFPLNELNNDEIYKII